MSLSIAFFGSSLVSPYWNGTATYYRGLIRALRERGHQITFYEPDSHGRHAHREVEDPPWARVVVYSVETASGLEFALEDAESADLVVQASGIGTFDEELGRAVLGLKSPARAVAYWDVAVPATLDRAENSSVDRFRLLIPGYDLVFTHGGGRRIAERYEKLGARCCVPIYDAVDPETHFPVGADSRFSGQVGFLGNRLHDPEDRVDEFFFAAAAAVPGCRFVLGGAGWEGKSRPDNVDYVGQVHVHEHNAFNSSVGIVLSVNGDGMARSGCSPAARLFEAAGAGACVASDACDDLERFLHPGTEVLIARDAEEIVDHVVSLDDDRRREIGAAARRRVLAEHTFAQRALDFERALEGDRTVGLSS
jgi:spore maturation protein CgeB